MPDISGVHHVTFVVGELDTGIAWFERALGARHIPRFDHHHESGALFGVVLELASFPGMVELRVATDSYPVPAGYDPVTFEVADDDAVQDWWEHFEAVGVDHSPVKRRRTGRSVEVTSPDGVIIRLFTAPTGGFGTVAFQEDDVDH